MSTMHEITACVICGRHLKLKRTHVDTCSERCYKRLLAEQRAVHRAIERMQRKRIAFEANTLRGIG